MLENLFPNYNFHYFGPQKPQSTKAVIVYSFGDSRDTLFVEKVEWLKSKLSDPEQKVILYLNSSHLSSDFPDDFLFNENLYIITDTPSDYQNLIQCRPTIQRNTQTFLEPQKLLFLPKRVILLTRDTRRVTHVNTYLLNSLSNIKITNAIDAKTPGALDAYLENNQLLVTQAIKAGMVGCFCSHHQLWKELLQDSTSPYYLVLEDDVIPHDSIVKDLRHILGEVPPTFDILFIYFNYSPSIVSVSTNFKYIQQVLPEVASEVEPTMCAYIISKKGAHKLVNSFTNIDDQLADMVYHEISEGNLDAYYSQKLIFTNIGVKETPKLISNTQSSTEYSKKDKTKAKYKLPQIKFW